MDTYLVGYSIADPKQLRKVAPGCEDFGLRNRFAVFFCRLSMTDLVRLRSRLYDIVDQDKDQVLFAPLCKRCAGRIETIGRPIEPHGARDAVIVR
ncbi:CRISPR-associated endonuclease Cas2 [Singulisphaera sp. Ch08]|uniref:CRISPR-associated endoribonuclease Cas2 n=1 Tax=Singulisphaera sp. Ch08 TaxID=3120278 RepID=A0AAU7CEH9_9BACT